MQSEIESYLDTLCGEIRCKYARRLVREEIKIHIEDNKKEGELKGMDSIEAEKKAAQAMGDPAEVGRMMDKLHRPKTDILMLISIAVLILFGLAVLGAAVQPNGGRSLFYLNPEWILFRVIGIASLILCLFIDFRSLLKKNAFVISSGVIGLAGLLFMNLTSARHGYWAIPNDWLAFANYIFICLTVISFAAVLPRIQKKGWASAIFATGVTLSVAAILLFRENAPRINAIFLLVSMIIMVWFINIKLLWKIIASVAIASIVLMYLLNHGIIEALLFYPERIGMSSEGETAVLKERLMHIQIIGQTPGLTEIWMSNLYLVFVNISAYVLLNFGILPAVILLAALGVLVWRLIRACARIRDAEGRVLAAGMAAFITVAILGSLLFNLLFIGTSGTYMPFQGTGPEFVLYSVFLGLIAGLYRRKELYASNAIPAEA